MLSRLWERITLIRRQRPVLLAGFIIIAVGIICLYLSDQVVTGWWQGTLDAFGVGFIIAGIVDVLAISALNQRIKAENERIKAENERLQSLNQQAEQILRSEKDPAKQAKALKELVQHYPELPNPALWLAIHASQLRPNEDP